MSKLLRNTPQEEAAISRGIAADTDTFVPTDEDFARMKPRRGRPKLSVRKELVSVRYDIEILEAFRSTGDGWQTRMNDALRDWLRTHRP
ncbi:hypothetical protein AWV79_25185 [Cupriavidus sp. UYMMa02A]|nr:hypothetical protein AWV80_30580 [Cupriavidus sp. UYMU48A]ODV42658.1 hypothetical protein AWV79_25185 [Cupriavidus sp. UYMMa02A]